MSLARTEEWGLCVPVLYGRGKKRRPFRSKRNNVSKEKANTGRGKRAEEDGNIGAVEVAKKDGKSTL